MRSSVWISYDLGVRGDYEGMYAWLDGHGAKECGHSLAYMLYEHASSLPESITADLQTSLNVNKNTRIYIIYRDDTTKIRGKFIIGRRKGAAWEGYAADIGETVDDEA